MVKDVIRVCSVSRIPGDPAILGTQDAGKEELGSSIPTVIKGDVLGNLLNAVRIRRDNKDSVLHTIMTDFKL